MPKKTMAENVGARPDDHGATVHRGWWGSQSHVLQPLLQSSWRLLHRSDYEFGLGQKVTAWAMTQHCWDVDESYCGV